LLVYRCFLKQLCLLLVVTAGARLKNMVKEDKQERSSNAACFHNKKLLDFFNFICYVSNDSIQKLDDKMFSFSVHGFFIQNLFGKAKYLMICFFISPILRKKIFFEDTLHGALFLGSQD
jgi:hypothetical protein